MKIAVCFGVVVGVCKRKADIKVVLAMGLVIKAVLVEEPSSGSGPIGTLGRTAGLTFEQQREW